MNKFMNHDQEKEEEQHLKQALHVLMAPNLEYYVLPNSLNLRNESESSFFAFILILHFDGKDGIITRLFSKTIEHMLEGELTAALGYGRYEAEGRNRDNRIIRSVNFN